MLRTGLGMQLHRNIFPKEKRQGNYKAGPGRPKGSKNKKTLELEAAVRAASAAIGKDVAGAFEGDAHAFLMAVYRDPAVPLELRILAASRALRVEKPALTVASVNGSVDVIPRPDDQ